MNSLVRFIISAPLAAIVTLILFLLMYNQLSPRPFLYATEEEPRSIYLVIADEEPRRICVDCGSSHWWLIPQRPDTSNPWTDSEKATKDAPELESPMCDFDCTPVSVELDPALRGKRSLHYCSGGTPLLDFRPPPYPDRCIKKRAEGTVIVRFDISKEGRTTNIVFVENPDDCFNAPIIKFIERRRYPPYCTTDGVPAVKTGITERFNFELSD